jgi:chromosome segregation ATPase
MSATAITKLHPGIESARMDQTAEALAHLKQMNDELIAANEEIKGLQADAQRERDRATWLEEELAKARADGQTYRDLVIELATQMNSIGEMTMTANRIVERVKELTAMQRAQASNG